jgi:subtilisin family serine protease
MTDSPISRWQRFLEAIRQRFPWSRPVRASQGLGDPDGDDRLDAEIAEFQLRLVEDALLDLGGVGGIPFDEGNEETAYLAHPARVVCRWTDAEERLQPFFDERRDLYVDPVTPVRMFGDLARYDLPARTDDKPHDIVRLLDEIEGSVGPEVGFPDHVVHVAVLGGGRMCPATEPELPLGSGPVPSRTHNDQAGLDIKVSVVDTGWHRDAADNVETPWLDDDVHAITGDPEVVVPTDIGPYVGHGTFVAGVIRCLAPAATLEVEGVLRHAGAVYESDIAAELNEAMTDLEEGELPDLISISAGTYTRNNAGLLAFEILAQVYRFGLEDDGPLVVAAAGNENTNREFYPAAYDWVVGVGALDEKMSAPRFSNYGTWVDVWAHGTKLVNAFPAGTYYVKEPGPAQGEERHFTGMAQWSGTSFATPIVTGAITALMSEKGLTARQAKQELFANHSQSFSSAPKVSNGIAVGPPFV